MIVIVCGGRNYRLRSELYTQMDRLHTDKPITLLRHGKATGADEVAGQWAKSRDVPVDEHPVTKEEWFIKGKGAGPERNQRMLDANPKPDLVVAFSGGYGTRDMVRRSRHSGVPVLDLRTRCRTCRIRYASRETAQAALDNAREARLTKGSGRRVENGYYECEDCGGWHLTSHARDSTQGIDTGNGGA